MNSTLVLTVTFVLTACGAPDAAHDAYAGTGNTPAQLSCTAPERIAVLPQPVAEASGIAPSLLRPGSFWVHNDSEGEAALYALDEQGRLVTRVFLPSTVEQQDWEDMATAPCGAGSCIYIADTGDNLHARRDIAILRFTEPQPGGQRVDSVERFPIRYPDEPWDAEAMFVLPQERVYLITKGRKGAVTLFRYPGELRSEQVTLEPVQQLTPGLVQLPDLVTGAAATPDGSRIAVRTYSRFDIYRMDGDTLVHLGSQDMAGAEPQGEGIAVAADGTVTLVSEVGPLHAPAPLTRLRCTLP